MVIPLFRSRKPFAFIEQQCGLFSRPFALLRLWNRRNELSAAALLDDLLSRLALLIELPITSWVAVGRVENGLFEEFIIHLYKRPLTTNGGSPKGILSCLSACSSVVGQINRPHDRRTMDYALGFDQKEPFPRIVRHDCPAHTEFDQFMAAKIFYFYLHYSHAFGLL